jgi:hypothetical protein
LRTETESEIGETIPSGSLSLASRRESKKKRENVCLVLPHRLPPGSLPLALSYLAHCDSPKKKKERQR